MDGFELIVIDLSWNCWPADGQVLLDVGRRPKDGISLKEIHGLQIEAGKYSGHDREILLAWDVVESHRIPQDDVFVLDRSIPAAQNHNCVMQCPTSKLHLRVKSKPLRTTIGPVFRSSQNIIQLELSPLSH